MSAYIEDLLYHVSTLAGYTVGLSAAGWLAIGYDNDPMVEVGCPAPTDLGSAVCLDPAFSQALATAMQLAGEIYTMATPDDSLGFLDDNPSPAKIKKPVVTMNGVEVGTWGDMAKLPAPDLSEAVELGCFVKGGSKPYRLIALGHMNAAFAWEGGTMSVRLAPVNPPEFAKPHISALKKIGFKVSPASASIHLDVGDDELLARKTLGSVLFAVAPGMLDEIDTTYLP